MGTMHTLEHAIVVKSTCTSNDANLTNDIATPVIIMVIVANKIISRTSFIIIQSLALYGANDKKDC